jgi:hypothetical protein
MRLTEITNPKATLVTWLDTSLLSGWFDSHDELTLEPLKMETLGWIIFQDEKVIVLAMSASEYKFGELLIIPTGCVQSVDMLPPKKKEKQR